MDSSEDKAPKKWSELSADFCLALSFGLFVFFSFLMLRQGEFWGPLILPFTLAVAGLLKSKKMSQRVIGIILLLLTGSALVDDLVSFISDL